MRANVKPLTHWIIYKKFTVRFHKRSIAEVTGTLTTPEESIEFSYQPQSMVLTLPDQQLQLNEHGWELSSTSLDPEALNIDAQNTKADYP